MNWQGLYININEEYLNYFLFVDDILLILKSIAELQEKLNYLKVKSVSNEE